MSNLKRRFIEVALVVVILLTLTSGRVFGEQTLHDFMFTPPNSIYQTYGYSEDTFRIYNILHLKDICQIFEGQIKALQAEIDELKKQIAGLVERNALQSERANVRLKEIDELLSDPNDVGEGKE